MRGEGWGLRPKKSDYRQDGGKEKSKDKGKEKAKDSKAQDAKAKGSKAKDSNNAKDSRPSKEKKQRNDDELDATVRWIEEDEGEGKGKGAASKRCKKDGKDRGRQHTFSCPLSVVAGHSLIGPLSLVPCPLPLVL